MQRGGAKRKLNRQEGEREALPVLISLPHDLRTDRSADMCFSAAGLPADEEAAVSVIAEIGKRLVLHSLSPRRVR